MSESWTCCTGERTALPRLLVTTRSFLMVNLTHLLCELKCLDLGILGRKISMSWEQCSIDTAFNGMSPDEARKMKRRFRKIARKMIKRERWVKYTPSQKRKEVMSQLHIDAWEQSIKLQYNKPDNDV